MSYPKDHKIKRPFAYASAADSAKPGYLEQKWDERKPGWRDPELARREVSFSEYKVATIGRKRS